MKGHAGGSLLAVRVPRIEPSLVREWDLEFGCQSAFSPRSSGAASLRFLLLVGLAAHLHCCRNSLFLLADHFLTALN